MDWALDKPILRSPCGTSQEQQSSFIWHSNKYNDHVCNQNLHVHAHQDTCYTDFSPSFVKNVGDEKGERVASKPAPDVCIFPEIR